MAELAPFGHDNVAVAVYGSSVRGIADAVLPFVRRQTKVGALRLVGVVAELCDDVPVFVQDRYAALQFGN